jgi:hypothetical protein
MGWSNEQQLRLSKEKEILNTYFPNFNFVNVGTNLCLEGTMYTNAKIAYKIRLYVPADVPYSVPDVVITSANAKDYYSRELTSHGASAGMHLLVPREGYPKICTYRGTNWNSNVTFYKVLVKVRLWLEALDGHKRTGQPLDYYLKHQ